LWPAAVLALALAVQLAAPARAQTEEEGRQAFERVCQACHQPGGTGVAGSFPPLAGNPRAADPSYVEQVIRNGLSGPLEVLGQTYDGVMPPATTLTEAEIAAVVAYVNGLAAGGGPTPTTAVPPPSSGDAAHGEQLFTGQVRLQNGGPACASCHSSTGPASPPGLGPDLKDVLSRLGGTAGVSAYLSAPASPTMQPIFDSRPLADIEIADLTAFLADAQSRPATAGLDRLALGGVAGLVVLMVFLAVAVRRPAPTYREKLRT
jgi:mono/diheme cytochrome c family protein